MTSQEAQASLVDQQLHRMSSHSSELRDLHTRQENADAQEEDGTAWKGPRLQKTAAGEKKSSRMTKEENGKGSRVANEAGTKQSWCETFTAIVGCHRARRRHLSPTTQATFVWA